MTHHGGRAANAGGVVVALKWQTLQVPAVDTALQVCHLYRKEEPKEDKSHDRNIRKPSVAKTKQTSSENALW